MIYHRTDCKRSGVPGLSARPEWRRRAASAELCVCAPQTIIKHQDPPEEHLFPWEHEGDGC